MSEDTQSVQLCFIGDIHGHAGKLETLLSRLNMSDSALKLVFVGDLIDNGKVAEIDHLTLLNKVKNLVDAGKAYCLMGNHEFNAIGWSLQKPDGNYCRDRNKPSNIKQHQAFINEVGLDSSEHLKWIEWFKQRPLFIDFGEVRTIHACWHHPSIERIRPYLNSDNTLKEAHWFDAFDEEHELYHLIEILLKGPEIALPAGYSFKDKTGTERFNTRVAWWKEPQDIHSYQDLAVISEAQRHQIPNIPVPTSALGYNSIQEVPVIVGHYTLDPTSSPQSLSPNVVCVDFNAAKQNNPLLGYLFDGENQENSGFIGELN